MNRLNLMLADMDMNDILDVQKQSMDSRFSYGMIIFGTLTLAVILATLLAVYFSLKKKKRKHKHRPHSNEPVRAVFAKTASGAEPPPVKTEERKKSRRVRRSHRPINPTLAQTRGLPPLRDENTPLPPMP